MTSGTLDPRRGALLEHVRSRQAELHTIISAFGVGEGEMSGVFSLLDELNRVAIGVCQDDQHYAQRHLDAAQAAIGDLRIQLVESVIGWNEPLSAESRHPMDENSCFLHHDDFPMLIAFLDRLLLTRPDAERAYAIEPEGRSIDWDAMADVLSGTEAAVLRAARALIPVERHGGLPADHPWAQGLNMLSSGHCG